MDVESYYEEFVKDFIWNAEKSFLSEVCDFMYMELERLNTNTYITPFALQAWAPPLPPGLIHS